jgi:hypothetical protein
MFGASFDQRKLSFIFMNSEKCFGSQTVRRIGTYMTAFEENNSFRYIVWLTLKYTYVYSLPILGLSACIPNLHEYFLLYIEF